MHVQLQYLELIYLVYKGYWVYSLIIVLFTCANTISLLRTLLAHETKMITLMNRPRLVPMVTGGGSGLQALTGPTLICTAPYRQPSSHFIDHSTA